MTKQKDAGLSWSDKDLEGMEYFLGDWWYGPRLNNPNNLPVKYESSDEGVATIDKNGVVTAHAVGDTWIKAIFEGNDEYEPQTIGYALMVKERYDLWVNSIQVTSDNRLDILGNRNFFYDEHNKMLVVTNNESPATIESRMESLTLFLNGSSRLERIFFNNQGNAERGALKITTYENIPGSVGLITDDPDGVISGFSSLTIDNEKLIFLQEPVRGDYSGGKLRTEEGGVAKQAIIGQNITPWSNGETKTFKEEDFVSGTKDVDLTCTVINNTLFTLVQSNPDPEDDDAYDSVEKAIVVNTIMTTKDVLKVANSVRENRIRIGSHEYAEVFKGITFLVPSGQGVIVVEAAVEDGYQMMVQIGFNEATAINPTIRNTFIIPYNAGDYTEIVYVFMVKKANGTRSGKRDRHHGSIYSVKVTPVKSSSNPLGNLPGFPDAQTPEVEKGTIEPTGIINIPIKPESEDAGEDNRWFTLSGQQIEQPTKAGLYIRNKKVIVIK